MLVKLCLLDLCEFRDLETIKSTVNVKCRCVNGKVKMLQIGCFAIVMGNKIWRRTRLELAPGFVCLAGYRSSYSA